MATKFGNAWYVRKDRIQIFIPLNENLQFEIDKTGLGKLIPNSEPQYSIYNFGSTEVSAISFSGLPSSSEAISFNSLQLSGEDDTSNGSSGNNGAINDLICNAIYTAGAKATINFWSYPTDDTTIMPSPMLGVSRNIVLADTYHQGYAFGVETHTSMMDAKHVSQNDVDYKYHILTALNSIAKDPLKDESELDDWTGEAGTFAINIPNNVWIMTTIVLDNSDSNNFKSTIHLRWYENGIPKHYWKSNTNMGTFAYDNDDSEGINTATVVDRRGGAWNIGHTLVESDGGLAPDRYFGGGLRNLMIYNVALSNEQQDTVFANGIDPYVAPEPKNTAPDEDQYDQRLWGKYGIIASKSNVKLEKVLFRAVPSTLTPAIIYNDMKHTTNVLDVDGNNTGIKVRQNKKRFSIASRDGANISISRDDVIEGETTNPDPIDSSDPNDNKYLNGFGDGTKSNVTAAAWRGGVVTGDRKLDIQKARTIWGGIINGVSDMMRIDPTINPTTLPAGKYITGWKMRDEGGDLITTRDEVGNLILSNYPKFLPKYFYRDRFGRSWRKFRSTLEDNIAENENAEGLALTNNKYVNDIFWTDGVRRYEKIEWFKPRVSGSETRLVRNEEGKPYNIEKIGNNPNINALHNDRSDDYQTDQASDWEPVYWSFAIYEIEREQTLDYNNDGTTKFANKIKLTLIDEDGQHSAVYYKYRRSPIMSGAITDGQYGGWQFESFNTQVNESSDAMTTKGANEIGGEFDKMASEFIRRIYLPHVTIPKLAIPYIRDGLAVDSVNLEAQNSSNIESAMMGGSAVYFMSDNCGSKYMITYDADSTTKSSVVPATITNEHPYTINTWKAPQTGWYEFTFGVPTGSRSAGARNIPAIKVSGSQYGDGTIYGYSGWYASSEGATAAYTTLTVVFYAKQGQNVKLTVTNGDDYSSIGLPRHIIGRLMSASTMLSTRLVRNVTMLSALDKTSAAYDTRSNYVVADKHGKPWIQLEGIAAKYTKSNKRVANPDGLPSTAISTITDTLTNVEASPYEE